ncbi:LysR substrate-binding domain-containing protein [Phocaeicola paurosaccharolyticus]|jgi:LysR family transcriptional regulator, transcriptional activator of the cysJI operon|uniref:LysR substrate-binding domain-containing protein n=1 Tax=Phocaeicola paurosaccharolyticus TaxID=732242 RepID=UPI002FDF94AB
MSSDFRLKVFSCVARNLSFTKASQELYISQPAITKHIHELETVYNTRLFERLGNKIQLTDSGKLLLEHCDKILDDYGKLEYEMNLLKNRFVGELRVGASTTISQYVLPPLLASFVDRFPDITLNLTSGNSTTIEKELQGHSIDIAIVEGNIKQPALKYTNFMDDELVLITRVGGKWKNLEEISVDKLKDIPLVLREIGSGTLDVIVNVLSNYNIRLSDLNIVMHLGSTESIKLYIENSDCMSIVSVRSIRRELNQERFRIVDIRDCVFNRNFNFVRLHGDDGGIPSLFMDYAMHYKQKL